MADCRSELLAAENTCWSALVLQPTRQVSPTTSAESIPDSWEPVIGQFSWTSEAGTSSWAADRVIWHDSGHRVTKLDQSPFLTQCGTMAGCPTLLRIVGGPW
ncbi:unnamed protein product, partial [Staurois parvus]